MKRQFVLILVLWQVLPVKGQQIERLSLGGGRGAIISHSASLQDISRSNPHGFSLHYQHMSTHKQRWNACHCFHYLGVQLSYHHFGNPDVLGSALGMSGTFEPLLWRRDRWSLGLLSGIGIVYLNRIYDENSNPTNIFFSSPISFLLFVTPRAEFQVSDQWSIRLLLNYHHISNGGQSQPNKGMNYPMAMISISRYLRNTFIPSYQRSFVDKRWRPYVEFGGTFRDAQWKSGRKPSISVAAGMVRPLSGINGWGGGIEITKDYSLDFEDSHWETFMPAPYLAHHFLFGRFDFSQRMAIYTRKPNGYSRNLLYQRYVLTFDISKGLTLGVTLKSHGHVAENIGARLGYKF